MTNKKPKKLIKSLFPQIENTKDTNDVIDEIIQHLKREREMKEIRDQFNTDLKKLLKE